jgi:Tfp pilus assembly protein PilF
MLLARDHGLSHKLAALAGAIRSQWGQLHAWMRRRPVTAALCFLLLLAGGAGAAVYGYALRQWSLAQKAIQEDRAAEAQSRLRFCLLIWPRSVLVHLLAARAAWLSAELEDAEALLNRCLELAHGATPAIQLEFLLLRVKAGEINEVAPGLLDYVLNGSEESPFILETMARAYMHNMQYGPAFGCLNRWVEEKPDSGRAYYYRGWVRERLNDHDGSIEDYEQALALDPDLAPVRLRLAEINLERTRPAEARAQLARLRQHFGNRPDLLARLGHCSLLEGKIEEARQLFEAAVQRLPDDPPLLHNLAKLELQEGRPAQAETWLRHALSVDGSDTEALYTLISALQFQHREREAAVTREEYEKRSAAMQRINTLLRDEARQPSNNPDTEAELGRLLLAQGHTSQALYWLDQALRHNPAQESPLRVLAEYYEKQGDLENANAYRRRLPEVTAKKPEEVKETNKETNN